MKRAWLLLWISASIACAEKADLGNTVQVERLTTSWVDAGVVDGKHKIVPSVTFMLKNASNQKLGLVQVNAVFRQVNDPMEWSSVYLPKAATELAPGASTSSITVNGEKGYTSDNPPDSMLKSAQFVDARIELFVRSGSSTWTKISDSAIDRKLITPSSTNENDDSGAR